MAYAEYLRVRKSLAWHAGILGIILLFVLYFAHGSQVEVNGTTRLMTGMAIALGPLATIGMFFAAIFASSQGASLNRENATRDLSWTKPISRTLLALQFVAIDVAGVLIAFALTMICVVLALLRAGLTPVVDPTFGTELALGAGVAVMWYALIQLLTFGFGPGARSISGILWPIALLALGLAKVDGPIGVAARAIDIVNPLAYMGGVRFDSTGSHSDAISALPLEVRPLVVWLFAALFTAIVVTLWPKKEA
jgi:hypothetical protein